MVQREFVKKGNVVVEDLRVLFIKTEKSMKPEMREYIKYFNSLEGFSAVSSENVDTLEYDKYDIVWDFRTFRGYKPNKKQILVHEYASTSGGKFKKMKDFIKRNFNYIPDLRVFTDNFIIGNDIKERFAFRDSIPYVIRELGVPKTFLNCEEVEKEFDFVYIGSVSKGRRTDKMLRKFLKTNNSGKFLIIGKPSNDIYMEFKDSKRIVFSGFVLQKDIPMIAKKAKYGVNYIPNVYPHNCQLHLKTLEYISLGLNLISTKYDSIEYFSKIYNCRFLIMDENDFLFSENIVNNFDFKNNFDSENQTWDKVIERSNIVKTLRRIYNNKNAIIK
jgi:hypothetical protein